MAEGLDELFGSQDLINEPVVSCLSLWAIFLPPAGDIMQIVLAFTSVILMFFSIGCGSSFYTYSKSFEPQEFNATILDQKHFIKFQRQGKRSRNSWVELTNSLSAYQIQSIYMPEFVSNGTSKSIGKSESEQLYIDLADSMVKTGLWSTVNVHTANPGARVEYQLIGRGVTDKSLTLTNDVMLSMPIGIYTFRVYRDDEITGELIGVRVIQEEESVEIVE